MVDFVNNIMWNWLAATTIKLFLSAEELSLLCQIVNKYLNTQQWCSPRGQALASRRLEANFYGLGLGLEGPGLGLGLGTCGLGLGLGGPGLGLRAVLTFFAITSRPIFMALASKVQALALMVEALALTTSLIHRQVVCIQTIWNAIKMPTTTDCFKEYSTN